MLSFARGIPGEWRLHRHHCSRADRDPLVWDKVLLKKPETKNLLSYVFWLGSLSVFGLVLAFFGFHMPRREIAALSFGSGALQLVAVYFYYAALKNGEASQTLAIMGGFAPAATVLIAMPLLPKQLAGGKLLAFLLMTAGGFVMFFAEKLDIRKIALYVALASVLFGLVNVLQKIVFNATNFVSGYVFFTLGTFAGSMFLLIRPRWRAQIFESAGKATPGSRFWYMVNRIMAGLGSFLIYLAISEENPAVVDAIAGVRYAIIFIAAYLLTRLRPQWLKEDFRPWPLAAKIVATALVVAGLVVLGLQRGDTSTVA